MNAYIREFAKSGPILRYVFVTQSMGFSAGMVKGFVDCEFTESPTFVQRTINGVMVGIGYAGLAVTSPIILGHAAECAIRKKDSGILKLYEMMGRGL